MGIVGDEDFLSAHIRECDVFRLRQWWSLFRSAQVNLPPCKATENMCVALQVTLAKFLERFESWEPESDAEPNWKVLPIKTLADDYTIKLTPRSPVGVTTVAEKVQTKVTTTNNV